MNLRAQARLDPGSWLPLGSQENALEDREHLSERQRVVFPVFQRIFLRAKRKPSGIQARLCPETHRRVPLAKMYKESKLVSLILKSPKTKVINHHFKWWFNISLQRAITTARPEGRYRKHCYWLRYKAVLLESSLLESSACSLIYFCTASSVILPIVST